MKWTQIPLGPLQTNAYIIENEKKEAVVIDPGSQGDELVKWLQNQGLTPLAILLTHAHFDHIGAVDAVRETFACPVYLHIAEKDWLLDPAKNGSARFTGNEPIVAKAAEKLIDKEERLTIGPFQFSILETPGHSPGSVSYYQEETEIVFSGDALFAGSIGRTDLPGGNHSQLLQSIHDKLLELPESTVVACGHGQTTTIGQEMDSNPFLSGF